MESKVGVAEWQYAPGSGAAGLAAGAPWIKLLTNKGSRRCEIAVAAAMAACSLFIHIN
jgi:hypothetical protein